MNKNQNCYDQYSRQGVVCELRAEEAFHLRKRVDPGKGRWPEGGDMGQGGLGRDKWEIAGPGWVELSQ